MCRGNLDSDTFWSGHALKISGRPSNRCQDRRVRSRLFVRVACADADAGHETRAHLTEAGNRRRAGGRLAIWPLCVRSLAAVFHQSRTAEAS